MDTLLSSLAGVFSAYLPTRVVFGDGSLERLGSECRPYGNSALLVTGASALNSGLAERCRSLLYAAHLEVGGYHSISADPSVDQVDEIAALAERGAYQMIVAVGGGSVLDAAKAAGVVFAQGGRAAEYLSGERPVRSGSLPVIAVPTTAGTGGEVSKGAILTWPEKLLKAGIRGDAVFPRVAVVDPELTTTLSREQTRISGFDVFTHAVETYVSRQANPITSALSRIAVEGVCRALPRILEQPDDRAARRELSFYSMCMGYNLANSSTCLPHRLQYPLGAITRTPHALGLSALYPAWVEATYGASRERFDDVAGWIAAGLSIAPPSGEDRISTCVRLFRQRIGLEPTLADLGVDRALCARLASLVSGELGNDPWWREGADLASLYVAALEA
jgi:alcohol dehydrogenase class IV